VTVTPDHRFLVSRKLKDEFENGEPYFPLSGQQIWLPNNVHSQPKREFLEWHADTLFKG
jgi:putative restriction endonuclease